MKRREPNGWLVFGLSLALVIGAVYVNVRI